MSSIEWGRYKIYYLLRHHSPQYCYHYAVVIILLLSRKYLLFKICVAIRILIFDG